MKQQKEITEMHHVPNVVVASGRECDMKSLRLKHYVINRRKMNGWRAKNHSVESELSTFIFYSYTVASYLMCPIYSLTTTRVFAYKI